MTHLDTAHQILKQAGEALHWLITEDAFGHEPGELQLEQREQA